MKSDTMSQILVRSWQSAAFSDVLALFGLLVSHRHHRSQGIVHTTWQFQGGVELRRSSLAWVLQSCLQMIHYWSSSTEPISQVGHHLWQQPLWLSRHKLSFQRYPGRKMSAKATYTTKLTYGSYLPDTLICGGSTSHDQPLQRRCMRRQNLG